MNLPNEGEQPESSANPVESKALGPADSLQKGITMAQIAKAAGVSQGAISSLLNDRDYGIRVSEKTRLRVFRVCREMGYIPNDLRAFVRMYPELGDLCLLVSSEFTEGLRDPFIHRIASAAMSATSDAAHPISLAIYDGAAEYLDDSEKLPHPVRSGAYSKFITIGASSEKLHEAIVRRGFPAVSLGYESRVTGVLSVIVNYAEASRIAIEHLARLGHQRLCIVAGSFGATSQKLLDLNRGVRVAFDSLKLPMDSQTIISGDLTERAGQLALADLMARNSKPTAAFCMSDAAAVGLITAARANGIRVPEDLSVIGCSDDPIAQWTHPQLTTVHLPAEEMAEAGIREINRLVQQATPGPAETIAVSPRIVERKSAAASKKAGA